MANDGTVQIGVEFSTKDIQNSFRKLQEEGRRLADSLKRIDDALEINPRNVDLLTEKYQTLRKAVANAEDQVSVLSEELEKARESGLEESDAEAYRELSSALEQAQEEARRSADALNDVTRELERSGIDAESLADSLDDVSRSSRSAEGSIDRVGDSLDEAADAADRNTESLEDMSDSLDDARENAEDFSDDLEDLNENADEGAGGMKSFFDSIAGGVMVGQLAAQGIGFLIGKVAELIDWVWNLDEATEEYRIAQGKLNAAFESAGYDIDTARSAYEEFYNILGDTDTATEASQLLGNMFNRTEELAYITGLLTDEYGLFANNIPVDALIQATAEAARTGEVTGALAETIEQAGGSAESLSEKLKTAGDGAEGFDRLKAISDELASSLFKNSDTAAKASQAFYELGLKTGALSDWAEISAGVYATFGDALPIEGLIEAANETAKVGQVTGVLADALNWAGMSEDELNDALSKTADEGDRVRLIMNNLSLAYRDAAAAFYEYNETLIESREAQAETDNTLAKLGESIAELKNKFFDLFGPIVIKAVEQFTTVLEQIIWVVDRIGQGLEWLGQKIKDVVGFFQELGGASRQVQEPGAGGRSSGGESARSAAPMALSEGDEGGGISTYALSRASGIAALEGAVPSARDRVLSELEAAIPAAQSRVAIATAAMAPSAAYSAPPPASYGNSDNGGRSQAPIVVRPQITIHFDGDLAQLGQVLHPIIESEGKRVGVGVQ